MASGWIGSFRSRAQASSLSIMIGWRSNETVGAGRIAPSASTNPARRSASSVSGASAGAPSASRSTCGSRMWVKRITSRAVRK